MFTRFFIDRPIFASVISIVITLAGALRCWSLPIAMFPPIAPPTVSVSCRYPGANAEVVADTVAAPIEQQVNGVENMMYMSSQSTNDGNYTLTVTFRQGIDLNLAQVLVQNRVSLAVPLLPDVVKATGVVTRKRSPDILMAVSLYSPDGRYDQLYLSNYALMRVKDELARIARHQRSGDVRPARLQHADLARPGDARRSGPQRRGRGRGPPRAEPPGGRGQGRPVADGPRPADPVHDHHPGKTRSGEGVRRRHRQEDRRRPIHPDSRPGEGGTRRQDLRRQQRGRRHAGRQHGDLPTPRRQRAGDRRFRSGRRSRS